MMNSSLLRFTIIYRIELIDLVCNSQYVFHTFNLNATVRENVHKIIISRSKWTAAFNNVEPDINNFIAEMQTNMIIALPAVAPN